MQYKLLCLLLLVLLAPLATIKAIDPPTGIRVHSADVIPSKRAIPMLAANQAIEFKVGRKPTWYSSKETDSLVLSPGNGLIDAIHLAYEKHHSLVLSPDAIWLAISQAISIHVNQNFDQLHSVLLMNQEKRTLSVRNDSLDKYPELWGSVAGQLALETKKWTKKQYYDRLVPHFTTTTQERTIAFQINLLEIFNQGFEYVAETGCGIPTIILTGTKQDWQWIAKQISLLDQLGLSDWKKELSPILNEFIRVFDGKTDPLFWSSIYKTSNEYAATYLSGWIIKFFPYLKTTEGKRLYTYKDQQFDVYRKGYRKNPFLYGNDYRLSNLQTEDFPTGIASAEIKWENHLTEKVTDMEFTAGFMGIKQYADFTLEPSITWAISDKAAKVSTLSPDIQSIDNNLHTSAELWSPVICESTPLKEAIYLPSRFTNAKESHEYVRSALLKELAKERCIGDSIDFVVMDNGEITQVSFYSRSLQTYDHNALPAKSKGEKAIAKHIESILKKMPGKWQPAEDYPDKIFNLMDGDEIRIYRNGKIEKWKEGERMKIHQRIKFNLL